jgi:hypothetical protein
MSNIWRSIANTLAHLPALEQNRAKVMQHWHKFISLNFVKFDICGSLRSFLLHRCLIFGDQLLTFQLICQILNDKEQKLCNIDTSLFPLIHQFSKNRLWPLHFLPKKLVSKFLSGHIWSNCRVKLKGTNFADALVNTDCLSRLLSHFLTWSSAPSPTYPAAFLAGLKMYILVFPILKSSCHWRSGVINLIVACKFFPA